MHWHLAPCATRGLIDKLTGLDFQVQTSYGSKSLDHQDEVVVYSSATAYMEQMHSEDKKEYPGSPLYMPRVKYFVI